MAQSRRSSKVWGFFDRSLDNNTAVCPTCAKQLSAASTGGTSHLLRHPCYKLWVATPAPFFPAAAVEVELTLPFALAPPPPLVPVAPEAPSLPPAPPPAPALVPVAAEALLFPPAWAPVFSPLLVPAALPASPVLPVTADDLDDLDLDALLALDIENFI